MMGTLLLGRLEVEIEGAHVSLAGRLDDTVALEELARQLPPGDVVIDCSGITFVNSFGLRAWVRFVQVIHERGTLRLDRVAECLMTQMNLMPALASEVRITSFHAQYICPVCGADPVTLVDAVAHAAELEGMRAPPIPCPECGSAMELGDFPERYLCLFSPA